MSVHHAELEDEQRFVDRAYEMLDRGLADAERSMAEFRPQHRSTAQAVQRALRILQESRGSGQLVFGKMRVDGEDLYIGRRRVHDQSREPLVISWHAPAAQRFYEASPAEPLGLELKRVFTEQDRRLLRILDEIVSAAAADATDTTGGGTAFSDALLAELDRSRDGAMREVVATIQAEQHAIIRAPLDRAVVVQGGPGTGKSVVGLHRAAWLAFNHEELRRSGVLAVAPNTSFLTYVSGVLPSLDVTDVDQVELQRLYAGEAEARGRDDDETARVKGSAAMATLLATALRQRIGWDEGDLELGLGADRIRVPASAIEAMLADVRARDLSHADGRDLVRDTLASLAAEIHRADQREAGRPARATEATIRRLSRVRQRARPDVAHLHPEEFLRGVYGTQTWLMRAAEGILTVDERARLYRPMSASVSEEPWTESDLFCLDEISALFTRDVVTYGHIVVDEAQDLSPMQARSLARRCPSGSFTVLGDLAQTTTTWLRDDWSELTEHLTGAPTDVRTLSIGYRVPAEVLELAARQLELAGPGLVAPRSIRRGAGAPAIVAAGTEASLLDGVQHRATESLEAGRSTAILVADGAYDAWAQALQSFSVGDGKDADFSRRLTLLPQSAAKGLEFDAVILVEPAAIAEEVVQPARSLYVAMTRCTQSLTILHHRPLPDGLSSAEPVAVPAGDQPRQRPGPGGVRDALPRRALVAPHDRQPQRRRPRAGSPAGEPTCHGP